MDPDLDYFENFAFVGITERFDEFLVGLATIFNWNIEDIAYNKRYKLVYGGPKPEDFAQEDISWFRNSTIIRQRTGIYESARRKSNQLLEELKGTCDYERNWLKV